MWESEFDNIVSKKDEIQDPNINQLKLEVHDTYEKDEKITTSFEPTDDTDVIKKAYPDDNLLKMNGHLSLLEKNYNEFILDYTQSVEVLNRRAVNTTIQILYDEGLFDSFTNADRVLKVFLFGTRRRPDLDKVNDAIQ